LSIHKQIDTRYGNQPVQSKLVASSWKPHQERVDKLNAAQRRKLTMDADDDVDDK